MSKTVLIIDDDDILRKALARGLRTSGFNVLASNSAENAIEVLARTTVDALILDRMMTGMDGLTLLKKLRRDGNTTPTIMLTAMTGAENAIDGLAGGADDYLAKPFQLRELELRLNNIIKKHDSTDLKMPTGLVFTDDEFFVQTNGNPPQLLALSGEEKKLLQHLTRPLGNIAAAAPMVAKRLRAKLNIVLSNLDIITIRGRGYKLIDKNTTHEQN
ncbi:MAG: response regulator transcription factor [Alphaproteobacteria bacterium]|nr:response regulator transcription factor [Alphaproteobacteria bacterium]MBR2482660.1 response regulator transcription factor [Alphaproteobacteria bacterium]